MVLAIELDLDSQIELLNGAANPVNRDTTLVAVNALGQVPTLITNDGQSLFDSRVICEYLDTLGNGGFFPQQAEQRWQALSNQSLADGMLDAALLARYEGALRPEANRWQGWVDGQLDKVRTGLDAFEQTLGGFADRLDIGTVTLACALGYLDFRFPQLNWRNSHPGLAAWYNTFSQRPSMQKTVPPAA